MTGPDHYRRAEQLLEHAASMLDTDIAPENRAGLIHRQATVLRPPVPVAAFSSAI
jgi:hypothetical protein